MPAAREDEASFRGRVVEHRLGCPGRVPVDTARDEYDEHALASGDGSLDHLAVVGRARNHGDALRERIELRHARGPADADHLVATIQRLLDHVLPQLPGGSNDAHFHG
jgi:hypothetical protein